MPVSTRNPLADLQAGKAVSEHALGEEYGLQDIATSGVVNTDSPRVRLTNTAGAATGVIFAPGRKAGQVCVVCNEGANTVTAATAATSNVRMGATLAILTLRTAYLVWDGVSRWDAIVSA